MQIANLIYFWHFHIISKLGWKSTSLRGSSQPEKLIRLADKQMKRFRVILIIQSHITHISETVSHTHVYARWRQKSAKWSIKIRKGVRGYSFQFPPLYLRICKYEFPKRSLYLYWDNFKQSVGLQGFYQFYYTLAEPNEQLVYVTELQLLMSVLVLVVFSLDKEIMAFHLPKIFSQVTQIIFYDRKNSKTKKSPQSRENVFLLIRMTQEKQKRKTSRENTGHG